MGEVMWNVVTAPVAQRRRILARPTQVVYESDVSKVSKVSKSEVMWNLVSS